MKLRQALKVLKQIYMGRTIDVSGLRWLCVRPRPIRRITFNRAMRRYRKAWGR